MSLTMMHEAGKKYQKIPLKMLGVTTCFFFVFGCCVGFKCQSGLFGQHDHPSIVFELKSYLELPDDDAEDDDRPRQLAHLFGS